MYNKLIDHVFKLITPFQFWVSTRKTTTVIVSHIAKFYESTAGNSQCDTIYVYLDFKKAFDSISLTNLLLKL